jgi:hypothetical protein
MAISLLQQPKTSGLLDYLQSIGGEDRHKFFKENNEPDIDAARVFAESMRKRLNDDSICIEQRVNMVKIRINVK